MMQFDKDMASTHAALFREVREFLLSHETIVETIKPRITTYSDENGGICHLRTMPHGIDIGFLKGAKMVDANRRLTGKGKAIRVLPLAKFDRETVQDFVNQAFALNK